MEIKIVDAICGSGKTSAAIEYIKNNADKNFIYVTPFLSEIQRVKTSCKPRRFYEPKDWNSKIKSLEDLIKKGKNIATTHSLFKSVDETMETLIKSQNYTLILDEVMSVIEPIDLTKKDLDIILAQELAYIDENYYLVWSDESYSGKYDSIKKMSQSNNLIVVNGVALLWSFPVSIFECFDEVWILTYIFDGQVQKAYFDFHNIEYDYYGVNKDMTEFTKGKHVSDTKYGNLINIYDGKYNHIGDSYAALSKSWFLKSDSSLIELLQRNVYNFFYTSTKSKTEYNMWTTFKSFQNVIKGRRYTKGFVSSNARATNEYKNKIYLAYVLNKFLNPLIKNFFSQKNIDFNEDAYATSELVQWIFRSQLRDRLPIELYIPSSRMRNLILEWCKNN